MHLLALHFVQPCPNHHKWATSSTNRYVQVTENVTEIGIEIEKYETKKVFVM